MNLLGIGECVTKISPEITDKYHTIPWSRIKRTRNIIAHDYFGVNLSIVWEIITEWLDELEEGVNQILNNF